jgi:hypothetical protein
MEILLGFSSGENIGFKDFFFFDIQSYVSNDQGYEELSGKKGEHEL